jgi:replicative DNA helicase
MTEELNRPPSSIEAEQWLLGGIMLDNMMWENVSDRVSPEDFFRQDHQIIFRAMVAQVDARQPLDVLTLSEYLKNSNQLDDVGGFAYLSRLVAETGSAANVRSYADIVRDRGLLRQLIHVGNEIAQSGYNPDGQSPKELVDVAERKVFEIAEQGSRREAGFVALSERCKPLTDMLDERHRKGDSITGLPSGYDKFDEITQGLQPGDLLILAARPSMGKTTLALNIAEYAAFKDEKPVPVAIFSMEMSTDQLALRFISSLGRVPQGSLRNGKFGEQDWSRIGAAIRQMSNAPVHIDDTPALSPSDVRARARRLKRAYPDLGLIVVDYLQLMQVPGSNENRTTEISAISRSLKSLARELKVPVIALSQLNRSVEQRPEKVPMMSDLRESGAIEQDADIILFIYRDEVYNKETERKNEADIIIAKHRNGELGRFTLTFLGQFSRFENHIPEQNVGGFRV